MNIHIAITRFCELGFVSVGRGYKHPYLPDDSIRTQTEDFLAQYPFLRKDQDYIDFLTYYAGAFMLRPETDTTIDIFGLTQASSHILELGGNVVDSNGLLVFSACLAKSMVDGKTHEEEIDFAFDASGKRDWGVYSVRTSDGVNFVRSYYCEKFIDWLVRLIENGGDPRL